jgi:DNA-binding MurR/RpiR family transcriptional regulator
MGSHVVNIRELLANGSVRFTHAELKVVRELMANYPAAGLNTIAHLAAKAHVSDPTVLRLVTKLGFDGYASFQRELLHEVEERMNSPLAMLDARRSGLQQRNVYATFMKSAADGLESAARMVLAADFEAAVELIADRRHRILCFGGRFSGFLAAILRAHLLQLRPNTEYIDGTASELVDRLVDIGRRDVLAVFDYRRYQRDTISFAQRASEQGARIILFTDPWKSPIAALADITIAAPVEVTSPYDSMVPALAQIEALIAALVARVERQAKGRIKHLEDLRRRHAITLDSDADFGRLGLRAKAKRANGRHRGRR